MSEPTVTLSALVEYHHEVLAPDFQRVYERLGMTSDHYQMFEWLK